MTLLIFIWKLLKMDVKSWSFVYKYIRIVTNYNCFRLIITVKVSHLLLNYHTRKNHPLFFHWPWCSTCPSHTEQFITRDWSTNCAYMRNFTLLISSFNGATRFITLGSSISRLEEIIPVWRNMQSRKKRAKTTYKLGRMTWRSWLCLICQTHHYEFCF